MEAREVRIGNLIRANYGLGYSDYIIVDKDTFSRFESDHVSFSGIAITYDILMDLGFEDENMCINYSRAFKFGNYYYFNNNLYFNYDGNYVRLTNLIRFVHELQNAIYCLTNEELLWNTSADTSGKK